MQHLYVDWPQYHRLIERLALDIHRSGWQFDAVIALACGWGICCRASSTGRWAY